MVEKNDKSILQVGNKRNDVIEARAANFRERKQVSSTQGSFRKQGARCRQLCAIMSDRAS